MTEELRKMGGLGSSFPNHLAVAAFLFAWAVRPIKLVRWRAILLEIEMAVFTPIIGAHYPVI